MLFLYNVNDKHSIYFKDYKAYDKHLIFSGLFPRLLHPR